MASPYTTTADVTRASEFRVRQRGVNGADRNVTWTYAGQGYGDPRVARLADQVREQIDEQRVLARDALNDLKADDARSGWAEPE